MSSRRYDPDLWIPVEVEPKKKKKKVSSLESGLEDHVPDFVSRIRFREKAKTSVFYIPLEMPLMPYDAGRLKKG